MQNPFQLFLRVCRMFLTCVFHPGSKEAPDICHSPPLPPRIMSVHFHGGSGCKCICWCSSRPFKTSKGTLSPLSTLPLALGQCQSPKLWPWCHDASTNMVGPQPNFADIKRNSLPNYHAILPDHGSMHLCLMLLISPRYSHLKEHFYLPPPMAHAHSWLNQKTLRGVNIMWWPRSTFLLHKLNSSD